jgi:uncharacterized membrane protein YphA (DoxX/SURF4 family)
MSASMASVNAGRHVFGMAALVLGVIALSWHEHNGFHLSRYVVYPAAATEIFGGVAIQFRRTAKIGAVVLGIVYLAFSLACAPAIVSKPQIYNNWGNFFEQLSIAIGAVIVYARLASAWPQESVSRMARMAVGICTASFCLEQAVYLQPTAGFVPKWIPPTQIFWAIATTVLFAVAAVALLTNRMALLASRLLTLMLVSFGLLVWVPRLFAGSRNPTNWSEFAETFAIAGTAWILADLLGERRVNAGTP